jgi:hypothetical protein
MVFSGAYPLILRLLCKKADQCDVTPFRKALHDYADDSADDATRP